MTDQANNPQHGDGKEEPNDNSLMQWAGVGIEFFGVIAVLGYLGYRLDLLWNTSPWLMIVFAFLGFVGMLYTIIKKAMNIPPR